MTPVRVTAGTAADAPVLAPELARVAAATFPLACPPSVAAADIAAFVRAHLSEHCFLRYLADPHRLVLTASAGGDVVGYAMLVHADPDVELSKIYVLPTHHRSGAAGALIQAGVGWAAQRGARGVWLGVNQNNLRAQRFYRKHGFEVTGTRTFQLGTSMQDDFVMRRDL